MHIQCESCVGRRTVWLRCLARTLGNKLLPPKALSLACKLAVCMLVEFIALMMRVARVPLASEYVEERKLSRR